MFRIGNNLIGLLNFLTFLLSIPILAGGIWLSARSTTDCDKFLDRPISPSASSSWSSPTCYRVSCLLWRYLLVTFLLIVLLFYFTIFSFVVTHKVVGEIVSGRGYKEYRLRDYSNWLQKRVNDSEKGSKIKSCLANNNVCKKLGASNDAETEFYQRNLLPIQWIGGKLQHWLDHTKAPIVDVLRMDKGGLNLVETRLNVTPRLIIRGLLTKLRMQHSSGQTHGDLRLENVILNHKLEVSFIDSKNGGVDDLSKKKDYEGVANIISEMFNKAHLNRIK